MKDQKKTKNKHLKYKGLDLHLRNTLIVKAAQCIYDLLHSVKLIKFKNF